MHNKTKRSISSCSLIPESDLGGFILFLKSNNTHRQWEGGDNKSHNPVAYSGPRLVQKEELRKKYKKT